MKIVIFLLVMTVIRSSLQQITILPPDTGARVCEGDSITLQCRVQFSGVAVPGTWRRDGTEIDVDNSTLSNHFIVPFNSTGEELLGLIIINVNLTDNNTTVYSCTFIGIDPPDSTTLYVAGPPSPIEMITVNSEACSVDFNISWDAVSSDQVCGSLLYDVTILPSDGVVTMRLTDTSYVFTGLLPSTSYIVTVTARNNAGVGHPNMTIVTTTTNTTSVLPDLSELANTTTTHNTIVVEWEVTSLPICGDVSLSVMLRSQNQRAIGGMIVNNNMTTFSNLENGTTYTITVIATNRVGNVTRMINVTTLGRPLSSSDASSGSDCAATTAIACVVTFILSVTVSVIITFIVTYIIVKRKYDKGSQDTTGKHPITSTDKVLYEPVSSPTHPTNDMEQIPAYTTSGKVIMDDNPAYESYKH